MKYLKLFENFTDIEDHFLNYIENGQCVESGNENCPIFNCSSIFCDKIKTRLDNLNINYGFNNNTFLFPSKEIMEFLDWKLSGVKKFTSSNISNLVGRNNGDYYGKTKDEILVEVLNGDIFYKYSGLWSILETRFKIRYNDICILMLWYGVSRLNLEVSDAHSKVWDHGYKFNIDFFKALSNDSFSFTLMYIIIIFHLPQCDRDGKSSPKV